MALLTAAQIKTILEGAVYPAAEGIEINAALMQNEERRKYPSIDVQNVTGEEHIKGYPTKTTGQTFLIHLFYRYRSFGEQHEPDIKALEDIIFDTIDANANFSTDVKATFHPENFEDPSYRCRKVLFRDKIYLNFICDFLYNITPDCRTIRKIIHF